MRLRRALDGGSMKIVLAAWLILVPGAVLTCAQELTLSSLEARLDALNEWLRDYRAWEQWFEQWGNRVAHNFDNRPIWDRKARPEPPIWLEAECQGYFGADEPLVSACYILDHWDQHPVLILQRRRSSRTPSGQAVETVVKTSFFRRVHLTGLWLQARYPAATAYGIVGMQIGAIEMGRFTLPTLGAMVVMIPDGDGGHQYKPATTLGVGCRLFDFAPPLLRRRASVHFNLARTNLYGVQADPIHVGMQEVYLFGLSMSPIRRR
jgi:hypothetical protein